jgi:hypothetical protein
MWMVTVPRTIRGERAWLPLLVPLLAGMLAAGCRQDLSGLLGGAAEGPDTADSGAGVGVDSAGSAIDRSRPPAPGDSRRVETETASDARGPEGNAALIPDGAPSRDADAPPASPDGGGGAPLDAAAGAPGRRPVEAGSLARGALLFLQFDEGPSTLFARDRSPVGQVVRLQSFAGALWTKGRFGGGVELAGGRTGGWLEVASSLSLNGIDEGFSISAWLRCPVRGCEGVIASRRAGGAQGFHYAFQINGERLRVLINSTNGYHADLTAPAALPRDRWVHVATTYDLEEVRLFIDGTLAALSEYQHPLGPDITPVLVGAAQTASGIEQRLSARLDEVVLYDRPLEAGEISRLAQGVELGFPSQPMGPRTSEQP